MIIYLSVALCLSRDIDQISDVVQIGWYRMILRSQEVTDIAVASESPPSQPRGSPVNTELRGAQKNVAKFCS